jgi:hypothetical protein
MSSKMSANKIVLRWEWRCFAPSLATIAQAVSIPSDAASRESDDIYVLDPKGDGKRQDPRRSAPDHRSKEWAALVRHRKRMSEKSREFLLAKLDRLIRETEKKIADLTKR